MTAPSPGPLPPGPATAPRVAARLSMDVDNPPADVAATVDAVNDWFLSLGRTPVLQADGVTWSPWPARWEEGCNMLATRIYRRRDSPAGVATFGAEGAVYVQRNDPDVSFLLGIGSYTKPRVG